MKLEQLTWLGPKISKCTAYMTEIDIEGCPTEFPEIASDQVIVCGSVSQTDPKQVEYLWVCRNLDVMRFVYERLGIFLKNDLHWYICREVSELAEIIHNTINS